MGEFFVYSFFVGMLLFLFPIFVYVDGYVDVRENKFWFAVSLYRHFKVFSGYTQLSGEGFVFHLTDKKAVILPYADMAKTRKKFEITKGFQLWRFHQIIEVSGANEPYGVMMAAAIQAVSAQAFSYLKTAHPFLSLRNSTVLSDRTELKVSLQFAAVFNGLVVSMAITKKLLEAIINWIRKKRLETSWKKQRSN